VYRTNSAAQRESVPRPSQFKGHCDGTQQDRNRKRTQSARFGRDGSRRLTGAAAVGVYGIAHISRPAASATVIPAAVSPTSIAQRRLPPRRGVGTSLAATWCG